MADQVGRERTKWCSGCHDPVVLFTGQMGAATQAAFSYDSWEAQQGLTCMSCHSITEVKDVKGNGSYVIEESKQYPFAFSKNTALAAVNRLLIRMEPSLHRKTFMKPVMRTPEFCSTCHKVALIPALNGYRWMRGQDHYDTWYDSGVSGRAVRSFYDPPQPKACRDCHLPPYRSDEFGNKGGFLHDHLFPAANTALPFIRNDAADAEDDPGFPAQQGPDGRPLRDPPGRRGRCPWPSRCRRCGPARRSTSRSSCARAASGIRTRTERRTPTRPGSRSPPTPAAGSSSRAARSTKTAGSTAAPTGCGRSSSTRTASTWIAASRRTSACRSTTTASAPAPPAWCTTASGFRRTPEDSITLSAGTHYRKFSRDYTTFSLGAAHPSLPVTTLASDTVDIPLAPPRGQRVGVRGEGPRGNPDPLWLRWNDYGIGLFLQGDLKGATQAWTRVAELAQDKPDGPLNRARAEIAEGRLADARASLAEAERRRPGWGKTAFFRATVAKDEGRLDDAEKDLKAVLEKFPLDRVAWNNLGLVYWLAGRLPDALNAYGRTLAIDPEDLNAHYNRMRVYRAHRRPQERGPGGRGVPEVQGRRDDPRDRGRLSPAQPLGQPGIAPDPRPRRGGAPAARRSGLGRADGPQGLRDRPRLPDAAAPAGAERARAVAVRREPPRAGRLLVSEGLLRALSPSDRHRPAVPPGPP